ncbi:MAG: hypothetical protein IH587_06835, partial [Anaerolineae bacterium]|nr:hypothetical protein [Anaerolineae bacterium]
RAQTDGDELRVEVNDSGSGIGLALVKLIVQRHGGSIQATSRLGDGTTMRVMLPLFRPDDQPHGQPRAKL